MLVFHHLAGITDQSTAGAPIYALLGLFAYADLHKAR